MISAVKPINVLIADDHQLFNEGLRTLLSFDGTPFRVVGQVYTGTEVIPAIHAWRPDVILLDINMPERNGLDISRQVVSEYPAVRVVIISMYSYQKFVDELKEIGVAGYLLKSASQHELIACLERIMRGETYFDIRLSGRAGSLHQQDEFVKRFKLSPRELEIIVLMKQGFSAPEIAKKLFISDETVKTHRKNIYYKLEINGLAELIVFANEQGL